MPVTRLLWLREGAKIPEGHRLLQVLMQEIRPEGTGTSSARWLLCELEILHEVEADNAVRFPASSAEPLAPDPRLMKEYDGGL